MHLTKVTLHPIFVIYGYSMISFPFKFGDSLAWTPTYLGLTLSVLLGFILAIWTMIYFKKMDHRNTSDE